MSRKKKIIIATLSVFLVLILGLFIMSRLRGASEGEFHGTLTLAFEDHDFQPDKSLEHWWLEDNEIFRETIHKDLSGRKVNWDVERPCYRIKLYGRLSSIGRHGHFGMWRRSLTIERMIEYEYVGNKPL